MAFDGDLRATLAGFAGALVVLAALVYFVGIGKIVAALGQADLWIVALIVPVALIWLLSWGLALRRVLSILGIEIDVREGFLLFTAAIFANNVTPFGQAGGEPITALMISSRARTEYETGLAAIASVDALNFVPSIIFASLGLGYYAATITLGRRLEIAAIAVATLAVAVPVLAYLGWQNRYAVERLAVRVVTPVIRLVWGLFPRRSPPSKSVLRSRVESFFHAIERIATDRRQVAIALSFSAVGWLGIMACLWLSLFALGHAVSLAAIFIVVPVGMIAGVTPLPGGLGGIDLILIAMLFPTTGVSLSTATAAVFIHRTFTYWFPLLIGGGSASAIGVESVF